MLRTSIVFLDAEAFYRENFNFSSRRFRRLSELVSHYRVTLFSTDLVFREIQSGIAERVRGAATALQKASKPDTAGILRNCTGISFEVLFSFPEEAVHEELLAQFISFVRANRIEAISTADVPNDIIFDLYFAHSPPFREGKKKSEFPDAFSLSAISEWCRNKQVQAFVISSDPDWKAFCEADDQLISLDSVDELLDLAASEDRLAEQARSIYEDSRDQIAKEAEQIFESLGFFLDDRDGDVELVDVSSVEILGEFLLSLDENTAVFGTDFQIVYHAEVSYEDREFGYYDNDDHSFYSMRSIVGEIEREASLSGEVFIDLRQARFEKVIRSDSGDVAVSVDRNHDYK
jgi:hypothetical protein